MPKVFAGGVIHIVSVFISSEGPGLGIIYDTTLVTCGI